MVDWSPLYTVPGTLTDKTAGAGVAIHDISNNGKPDLVVFRVDENPGHNSAYYRIGWDLDEEGAVTGGWTEWMGLPFTFGLRGAGAGITVNRIAKLDRPDLVVFQIEDLETENVGQYRIGWDLRKVGSARSWSALKTVPNWFGSLNQGAGITAADVSRNGKKDLVVFSVDAPEGENGGYIRVGWDVNEEGDVTGWTEPMWIPGWWGHGTAGGGIDLGRFRTRDEIDVFVWQLDDPYGENRGVYRIGRNLQPNGVVEKWSDPIGLPDGMWFGSLNQGGGLAVTENVVPGRPDLYVMHVDNRAGPNTMHYRVGFSFC